MPDGDVCFEGNGTFHIVLHQAPTQLGDLGFDFGLPGIPFKTSDTSSIALTLGYTMDLTFQALGSGGITILNNGSSPSTITFDVQANVESSNGVPSVIHGTLGGIPVTLTDAGSSPSSFNGVYTIPLENNGAAGINDVVQGSLASPSLQSVKNFTQASDGTYTLAPATENFLIEPNIEEKIPAEIPSVGATINISWNIDGNKGGDDNPLDLQQGKPLGEAPTVTFKNGVVDLGSILGPGLEPIVQELQKFTKPLGAITGFLEQNVPVLDDIEKLIGRKPLTWADLILDFFVSDSKTQQTDATDLKDLNSGVKLINELQAMTTKGPSGTNQDDGLLLNLGSSFKTTGDPRDSGLDPSGNAPGHATGIPVAALSVQDPQPAKPNSSGISSQLQNASTSGNPLQQLNSFLGQFTITDPLTGQSEPVLELPILQDPANALDLYLGRNEPILLFNIPRVGINGQISVPIIIPTPLPGILVNLQFGGTFGLDFQGTIGYDTLGFHTGNPFDGLFLDDVGFDMSVGFAGTAGISALEIVNLNTNFSLSLGLAFTLAAKTPHPVNEAPLGESGDNTLNPDVNPETAASPISPTDGDVVRASDFEDGNLALDVTPSIQVAASIGVGLGPFNIFGSWNWGVNETVNLPGINIDPPPRQAVNPAATDVWTGLGTDDLWTDPLNWRDNLTPRPGDDLVFPAVAGQTTNVDDFAAGTKFASLTFDGTYVVSGNPLVIGAGGITGLGANSIVINNLLALSTDPPLTAADPGTTLDLAGGLNTAGQNIVVDGNGTTLLGGTISGGGGITKQGAGQLFLGGTNSFSGGTDIQDGTIIPTNNQGLGSGGASVQNGAHLLP